jgi:hypothetical protein
MSLLEDLQGAMKRASCKDGKDMRVQHQEIKGKNIDMRAEKRGHTCIVPGNVCIGSLDVRRIPWYTFAWLVRDNGFEKNRHPVNDGFYSKMKYTKLFNFP